MKMGLFAAQVNEVEQVFKDLGLLAERVLRPPYANYAAYAFRGLRYIECWRKCFDLQLYDLRLRDDGLIQFRANSFKPLSFSYAFYECPYHVLPSLDDYIEQVQLESEAGIGTTGYEFDLLREYDFLQPTLKDIVTPLRYDYSPEIYTESRHPAAHMHFGFANEIRVGTKKVLRPLSFTLFIVRHYYPDHWQQLIEKTGADILCRNVHEGLDDVSDQYWGPKDKWEMLLA
jgi:hypothetical protein